MIRRLLTLITLVATTSACGDVVRQGRSPVSLVIDSLTGAPSGGFGADKFSSVLFSDVLVNVTTPAPCAPTSPCPTVYSDRGQVVLRLVPKDISIAPTANNQVTIARLRITYRRADGRNTPGVDVPFGIDEAVTATVPAAGAYTLPFELVRHIAKEEAPLVQLIVNPNIIHAIAEITFYGTDQVGNDISVTGSISIEFGNFGDQ